MDRSQNIGTNSIFVFIWSFIFAVFVSSFFFLPPLISIFIILVGTAILAVDKVSLFLSIALISFGLGILRYDIKDFHTEIMPSTTGVVINEPEQRENTTRFVFLSDNGEKILVNTGLYSAVQYGDQVEISGKLAKPGIIEDFNYGTYLSKDDIYFVMNFTEVEIISSGHGNIIKSKLLSLKQSIVNKMRNIFTEPESSLLAGLILAGKSALPKNVLEEFRRAGIIHIVVLSGYNITIIADFLKKIFGPVAAIVGVLLFVVMTGAEATVVRAAIMVLIVVAAKNFRRPYSAPRALLAAGFLMVMHNPKILVFDASFQLSFLATCGLIYVVPKVMQHLQWITEKFKTREIIATTIGTQITVLPFLIYLTREVSIVSLPANILVLFFIPYVMFAGFFAALIAYVSAIPALPLTYLAHLILSWILFVADFLGNLSFATASF
ncbi:MAG: ComEC/Rec2 family competence protein [Candidatus Zambryskibacteria bacterium]|nr:ComEC/Rec2 family competence protein [Candidatus Zambryskibacteria bacterium]